MAIAIRVTKKVPRRMLMYLGHKAAISIPAETPLRTVQRANWLARNPRPAKNVPALAPGDIEFFWMVRRSSNGFHKTSPYRVAVAEVMIRPQSAVTEIARGAVTAWPKSAALGVLEYRVQSYQKMATG